jgi:translation initiation factor 2 alpha subunit (eIF-2alpha)
MTKDVEGWLALAAKELVLAAEELDPIKKSHHLEFADRYFAAATAMKDELTSPSQPRQSWLGSIFEILSEGVKSLPRAIKHGRLDRTQRLLPK